MLSSAPRSINLSTIKFFKENIIIETFESDYIKPLFKNVCESKVNVRELEYFLESSRTLALVSSLLPGPHPLSVKSKQKTEQDQNLSQLYL